MSAGSHRGRVGLRTAALVTLLAAQPRPTAAATATPTTGETTVSIAEQQPATVASTPAAVWSGDEVRGIHVQAQLIAAELELIRAELGAPVSRRGAFPVKTVSLRDVMYVVLTLQRKTDVLVFEHTRRPPAAATPPSGTVTASDVRRVLDSTTTRLQAVKAELGIPETATAGAIGSSTVPDDVFLEVMDANRQINLMLERRFGPADAYEQVTLAMGYATRLLDGFPQVTTMPPTPPYERRKTPTDVYSALLECQRHIEAIASASGVGILRFAPTSEDMEIATPADVYDIASMLVSELSHLQSIADPGATAPPTYYPGPKVPSHVYQRVGILAQQLEQLEARVRRDPKWLRIE